MLYRFACKILCIAGITLLSANAATIAACNASQTQCGIPENVLLQLPFTAIAGDVLLIEPVRGSISDVFRIFNNIIDTGGGTGLGNMVFLYSADDSSLPPTSSFSANAVSITENLTGATTFVGNGTTYLLGVPEPQTFGLIWLAATVLAARARKQAAPIEEAGDADATH